MLRSEIVSSDELPHKDGQRKTFVTSSFAEIHPLRSRLFFAALESEKTNAYRYHAHPYWAVCPSSTSIDFMQSLAEHDVEVFTVVGNEGALDLHGVDQYNGRLQHTGTCSIDVPFLREGYVLEVVGDFIIEIILDDEINNNVSFLFESVENAKDFDEELLLHIFNMEAQTTLTMKRNAKEAEKLRTILQAYFAS